MPPASVVDVKIPIPYTRPFSNNFFYNQIH